jgi:RNA polymerase sigma-70 factor, ECF subfamily
MERVIREHGDLLDRVAWGYVDNAHDLEDLMQEILMALWRALPRFRGESSARAGCLTATILERSVTRRSHVNLSGRRQSRYARGIEKLRTAFYPGR